MGDPDVTAWQQRRDPRGHDGPLLIVVFAAPYVALQALSQPTLPTRLDAWRLFAAWIAVMLAAASARWGRRRSTRSVGWRGGSPRHPTT